MNKKYEKYLKAWKKREREIKAQAAEIRQDALRTARRLSRILARDFGARRVVLVGSALKPEKFGKNSDIDLAVEGIRDELFFKAYGTCLMKSSYSVDLIDTENASELMKKNISQGKVLYEKQ